MPPQSAGPVTHISSLAGLHSQVVIQMVKPIDLYYSLDCSTDLPDTFHETLGNWYMDRQFPELMDTKYENCSEWYLTNLTTLGVQEPIVVIIRRDNGRWQMDEGHHRLSWALRNHIPEIPVVFDDSGADDNSHMGFIVARANVEAYHSTVTEEYLVSALRARQEAEAQTDEFPAVSSGFALGVEIGDTETALIPVPRKENGGRRKGGRHRRD